MMALTWLRALMSLASAVAAWNTVTVVLVDMQIKPLDTTNGSHTLPLAGLGLPLLSFSDTGSSKCVIGNVAWA